MSLDFYDHKTAADRLRGIRRRRSLGELAGEIGLFVFIIAACAVATHILAVVIYGEERVNEMLIRMIYGGA